MKSESRYSFRLVADALALTVKDTAAGQIWTMQEPANNRSQVYVYRRAPDSQR